MTTGEYLYGVDIDVLLKKWADRFNDKAKIKLKACGSANPNAKLPAAKAFKTALPEAEVFGYTGLMLDVPFLFEGPVPNMKPFTGNNPWTTPGKAELEGVPLKSRYIQLP